MSWARPYDWKMPWFPFEEHGFVFAHPPLFLYWVKAIQSWFGLSTAQWILGCPWQLLFLFSVNKLFQKFLKPKQTWLALFMLLTCVGVYLPLTRSLMPDLMMTSIATFSIWCWMAAQTRGQVFRAGILLGIASWVKYPALLLILLPLLYEKERGRLLWFLLGCGLVLLFAEGWLYLLYGDVHLLEVLRRAPEIPRSSFGSRGIGILNRLGISLLPLALILGTQQAKTTWLWGLVGGLASVFYAYGLGLETLWFAFPFGFLGAVILSTLRISSLWSFWTAVVLLGVWITHNYAAPRYWMLISIPLLIQVLETFSIKKWHVGLLISSTVFCIAMTQAELLHSEETDRLAEAVHQKFESVAFTGEWTFRWKMEHLGHVFMADTRPAEVAWALNSAGGVAAADYRFVERFTAQNTRLSLVNSQRSVGYYADSLGFWPLWIAEEPIETVEIWKRK